MKSRIILRWAIAALLIVQFSCGEKDEEKSEYFISFKVNGAPKTFKFSEPGYQSCGNCACITLPPVGSSSASLFVCNDENLWITKEDIESWDKTVINFSGGSGFPIARFYFSDNVSYYDSDFISNQAGSALTINSVIPDGKFFDYQLYKVSGTFNCKVKGVGSAEEIVITDGSFVIRLAED